MIPAVPSLPPYAFTSCMFTLTLCTRPYIITSQKAVVFVITAMGTLVITLHLILQHQSTKKTVLTSECLYYSASFFTDAFVFVKEKGNGHPITYHSRHRWGVDGQLLIFLTFNRYIMGGTAVALAPGPLPILCAALLKLSAAHTLNKVQYLADRDVDRVAWCLNHSFASAS